MRAWLERRWLTDGGRKVTYYTLAHNLYNLLAGGFEIALILRLTGSFERVVLFNLIYFVALYAFFVIGTYLLRRGRASRSFRWDLGFIAGSCLYLVAGFPWLGNPWVLAGFFALKGVSEGLFWSARHSAVLHSVADEARDRWSVNLQSVSIVLGMILPVLSGFAITYLVFPGTLGSGLAGLPSGYLSVYLLTSVLALLALLLSPTLRIPDQTVRLGPMIRALQAPKQGVFLTFLFAGDFSWISVGIAMGILNFTVLKTEFNLGLFASWIAAASAVFFFGVVRVLRRYPLSRVRMVFVGTSGDIVSRVLYLLVPTVPGLIGKSLLDSFITPLAQLFGENIVRLRLERLAAERGLSLAEIVLFQETVYLGSRIVICGGLWLLLQGSGFDPAAVARTLLLVFAFYGLVDFALLRSIDRGNRRPASNP